MNITRKSLRACYRDLAERASIDLDFLLLTVVAAVICTFGFRMNSASVIIGAMVISPLLYPVICVGAATFHRERGPFLRAAATLAAGLLSAIVAAAIVSLFATTRMRSEIVDRVSMQAVDYLFVALFSGVAGTYAFFRPKFTKPSPALRFPSPWFRRSPCWASGSRIGTRVLSMQASRSCFATSAEFILARSQWSPVCIG